MLVDFQADGSGLMSAQVEPQEKKKTPKGRAKKRITYTRRFVNVTMTGGKRKVCGSNTLHEAFGRDWMFTELSLRDR